MLRVYTARRLGWHALAAGEHNALLHEYLVDNCQHLNSIAIDLANNPSTYASERTVRGVRVLSEFTFVKISGGDMLSTETVDAHLSTGTVYGARDCAITVFRDSSSCVVTSGACSERLPLSNIVSHAHATYLSLPPPPGTVGPCRRVRCKKLARARRARFLVYVHCDVDRVKFVVNTEQKRSTLKTTPVPPFCVNACYSSHLAGAVRGAGFCCRQTAGGAIMCFPSALGNVNLYPGRGGRHKVTFKAFQLLPSVHQALDLVCGLTGTTSPHVIALQMIVLECRTGMYMDIALDGFVHGYFRQFLHASGPSFSPVLDEINVHALLAWSGLQGLYTALLHAPAPAFLADMDLTLSVTRLGTLILRFCFRASAAPHAYDAGMEAATLRIAQEIHRVFCTFPGA